MKQYQLLFLLIFISFSCKNNKPSTTISNPPEKNTTTITDTLQPKEDTNNFSEPSVVDSKEYKYEEALVSLDNQSTGNPYSIRFRSGKEIKISEIDPYEKIGLKDINESKASGEHLYDMLQASDEIKTKFLSIGINYDANHQSNYLRMLTNSPIVESSEKYVVAAFHASIYSSEEDILATQGEALVYNQKGTLKYKISDAKAGFYDIVLSSDEQSLMQKHGIDYGEDGSGQLTRGFKFYDLETGKLLSEWDFGKDQFIRSYGNNGKGIDGFHVVRYPPNKIEYHYFFPQEDEVYMASFNRSENTDSIFEKIAEQLNPKKDNFKNLILSNGFKKLK